MATDHPKGNTSKRCHDSNVGSETEKFGPGEEPVVKMSRRCHRFGKHDSGHERDEDGDDDGTKKAKCDFEGDLSSTSNRNTSPQRPESSGQIYGSSPENSDDTGSDDTSSSSDRQLLFSQSSRDQCILPEMSNWRMEGTSASLVRILQLNICNVIVDSSDIDAFFGKVDHVSFHSDPVFDGNLYAFIRDLCSAMNFCVKDLPGKGRKKHYMYDGYGKQENRNEKKRVLDELLVSNDRVVALLQQQIQCNFPGRSRLLIKYAAKALDFIGDVTDFVRTAQQQTERSFERLFTLFASLVGLDLVDAACQSPREMTIYGVKVRGKPDLRSFMKLPDIKWCNGLLVEHIIDSQPLVTSVVEVKIEALSTEVPQEHAWPSLGQLLAEMLGELRNAKTADSTQREMIGMLVMSTRVQFVLLKIPESLKELYGKDVDECFDDSIDMDKTEVFVTNWFDYLKPEHRAILLRMLFKLSSVIRMPTHTS